MTIRLLIALLGAASRVCGAEAQDAPDGADTRRIELHYADLDLRTSDGAAALLDRIDAAARVVCSPPASILAIPDRAAFKDCMRATMDKVVADIGITSVAQVYHQWSSVAAGE